MGNTKVIPIKSIEKDANDNLARSHKREPKAGLKNKFT